MQKIPIRSFEEFHPNLKQSKFEIEAVEISNDKPEVDMEAHRHDYYHIFFVRKGSGEHLIDFKKYEIISNSVFFVSPGQVHAFRIKKETEGYILTFDSEFFLLRNDMQKLIDFPFFHSVSNVPFVYLSPDDRKIQMILDDIYTEYNSKEKGRDKLIQALFEVFLIHVSRKYQEAKLDSVPEYLSYQLRKLEALIDQHYVEYKKLDDYADLMHLSAKHLNSLCKKGLDKTVTNLIHERTIIEAKRLLLFTDDTITEIAFALGFNEKSYFMKFFKKHTRYTADEFRKQEKL